MIEIVFRDNHAVALDKNTQVGECEFIEKEDTWNIIRTVVDDMYKGRGIARKLVERVILEASKSNKKVIATCSYAQKILDEKYNK